jgi:hypothetical protein
MLTKEQLINKLMTDDRWLGRGLMALAARQTEDERQQEVTKYHNQQGFRPCHAKRGTSMAAFYQRAGFLTPKQKAWWRASTENAGPRIAVYATQLLKVAEQKKG